MSFNPDRTMQAQEDIFSGNTNKIVHLPLYFNNTTVKLKHTQKHTGFQIDSNLSFNKHTNNKISKATKGIGNIRKLQPIFTTQKLIGHLRPHLHYGHVIYDQPSNASFSYKIESLQYNAAMAITGAIKCSSRDKLYQELGLKHLQQIRWMRQFFCSLKSFQQSNHPIFITYTHKWEILTDTLTLSLYFLVELNKKTLFSACH